MKWQSSRQAFTQQPSDEIPATQDEMSSEVRIGLTPEVIAIQTPDITAQFQCELIITFTLHRMTKYYIYKEMVWSNVISGSRGH